MNRDELLKAINTRELIGAYKTNIFCNSIQLDRMIKGGICIVHKYSIDEIKHELSLRPHVPNKNEARGLRIKKIKEGK